MRARMHDILMCAPVLVMWFFDFLMARFLVISIFPFEKRFAYDFTGSACSKIAVCMRGYVLINFFYCLLGTYIRVFRGLRG